MPADRLGDASHFLGVTREQVASGSTIQRRGFHVDRLANRCQTAKYQPDAWRAAGDMGGNEARERDAPLGGATAGRIADAGPRQLDFASAP